jgi:hypothetical protein
MNLLRTFVIATGLPLLAGGSVINDGTITITGIAPTGNFNFSGSEFSASGTFEFGNWSLAGALAPPGGSLGVNGFVFGDDFGFGGATVSGTDFGAVNWGSFLAPRASVFSITGLPITLDHGPGIYAGTFTFTGGLCGNPGGNPPTCAVDLPDLTGSGTVSVNIVPRAGLLTSESATYTFIAEPGTWMMVPGGIAAILACAAFRGRIKRR